MEPDNTDVLGWRAALLAFVGKDATTETTRLREIDPLTPFSQVMCGLCTFTEGHFAAAVDYFGRIKEMR